MSLFTELKRRKVVRVAVVSAATAFIVLQATQLFTSGLGLRKAAIAEPLP